MDIEPKKWQYVTRPQQTCKVEKDGDLVGMLSKQLYLAGDQMQRMQAVLKKAEDRMKVKDQEINRLKRRVRDWQIKLKDHEIANKKEKLQPIILSEKSDHIHQQYSKLEHKIFEMEKFLADHGLIWVGGNSTIKNKSSEKLSNSYINGCYAKLIANIEELNLSVGKGEMHVCHYQGGAIFKARACIVLKFYKNGLIVGEKGRLRHYHKSTTQSFIRDILDGYFPSELQHDYPNGVAFKVEDHRTQTHFGDGFNYPGHGYQLGKLSSCGQIRLTTSSPKVKISSTPRKSSLSDWQQRWNSSSINVATNTARVRMSKSAVSNGILKATSPNTGKLDEFILDSRSQMHTPYNNYLGTYLKSHRTEKVLPSTKNSEYYLPLKEKLSNKKYTGYIPSTLSTTPVSLRSNSVDRSPADISCSRTSGTTIGVGPGRPKSINLSSSCSSSKPFSKLSFDSNTALLRNINNKNERKLSQLRVSKSVTLGKCDSEIPILQEVNEASGEPGELRLKVRSMTGTVVYLVHISADDTVARLYQLLNTVLSLRRTSNSAAYKIVISGYAPNRLDHMNVTLRDYGINRDSVLHLVDN